ncbi:hypothetical protein D3C80_1767100 [compost metagenome]
MSDGITGKHETDLFMLRHQQSMEYVSFVAANGVHTSKRWDEAMYFPSREAAEKQQSVLPHKLGNTYVVMYAQMTGVR